MRVEMPFVAACVAHEVQNRLVAALTQWSESLNHRLAEKGKARLAINRSDCRLIGGTVRVSASLLGMFPSIQSDLDHLTETLVLHGMVIKIPQCYDSPEDLSLMFIRAEGKPYDGYAVQLFRSSSDQRELPFVDRASRCTSAFLNDPLGTLFDDIQKQVQSKSEWVISRTSFHPRIHGHWFSQLLSALQRFDLTLYVQEIHGEFLPSHRQFDETSETDFSRAMMVLANEYLDSVSDAGL